MQGARPSSPPTQPFLFCLLFSVFYSSALRLGVSAPVRASCSLAEERGLFVFVTGSRPLWVEMFNRGPAVRRGETSPYWQERKSTALPARRRRCKVASFGDLATKQKKKEEKSETFHKDGGGFHVAADRSAARRRPQPLRCVKLTPSEERDLFRLACNACWEILECEEWGTVVLSAAIWLHGANGTQHVSRADRARFSCAD